MSDGATFRARATRPFRLVGTLLALGGGAAAVLAGRVYAGASVLWVMSQDGA